MDYLVDIWDQETVCMIDRELTSSQSSVDAIAKQQNCQVIEVLRLLGLQGEQDRTARRSELVEYQATGTARKQKLLKIVPKNLNVP